MNSLYKNYYVKNGLTSILFIILLIIVWPYLKMSVVFFIPIFLIFSYLYIYLIISLIVDLIIFTYEFIKKKKTRK